MNPAPPVIKMRIRLLRNWNKACRFRADFVPMGCAMIAHRMHNKVREQLEFKTPSQFREQRGR